MSDLKAFDQLKASVSVFVGPVKSLTVSDPESSSVALATGKQIKDYAKAVEEKRVELVKPYNDLVKSVNAYAKEIAAPLEEAEAHIKKQLLAYSQVLEKQRQKAMAEAEAERVRLAKIESERIAAEREAAETVAMFSKAEEAQVHKIAVDAEEHRVREEQVKAHAAKVADINSNKVSGVRKTWAFRITDQAKVPREFLIVDPAKIREAVRLGVREIEGVEIYQETSMAIR